MTQPIPKNGSVVLLYKNCPCIFEKINHDIDEHIILKPDEQILCQEVCARHGFWSLFAGKLVFTNLSFIFINYGALGNFKGRIRFDLSGIVQIVVNESRNSKPQLGIYHTEEDDDFAFKSGRKHRLIPCAQAIKRAQARSGTKTSNGKITRAVGNLFSHRMQSRL